MHVQAARVIPHGVVAGMIGYAVIVLAYAAVNVVQGLSVFDTATRLGTYLVTVPDGAPAALGSAPVIAFNGVHLAAALLAGCILNWLVTQWETNPGAGYFFLFVLIAGLIMGTFLSAVLLVELAGVVGWTQVLVVNLLAALAMVSYEFAVHPELRRELPRLVPLP